MGINQQTGLIEGVRYLPSPHADHRPDGMAIDLLVIHAISLPPNQFSGDAVEKFFTNQLDCTSHPFYEQIADMKVSAHLFIRRDGHLLQFVPFHRRAWHAGVSAFAGRTHCNDFSIGIELEGCGDLPFELIQYQQLLTVTNSVRDAYPNITKSRIVGHSDIAPGRKTDPGPHFDWDYYQGLLT